MVTKKSWLRPTQKTRTFPTNKYDFDNVLVDEGDWAKTSPLPREEVDKLKKALSAWAFYRKKTVKFERFYLPNNMEYAYISLEKSYRERDFR